MARETAILGNMDLGWSIVSGTVAQSHPIIADMRDMLKDEEPSFGAPGKINPYEFPSELSMA